jgi:hypothetical protein
MRGAIAIACLTSCGGSGADVEVRSHGVAIDSVELFVAPGACTRPNGSPCASGIAWATDLPDQPPGEILLLSDTAALTAKATGNAATFRLEAVAGSTHVARVAAIGMSQGQPVAAGLLAPDLDIPLSHAEVWQLPLAPMADVAAGDPDLPPAANAPTDRVHVWTSDRRAPGLTDCAMIQHWDRFQWDRQYFVPPIDRDCDGEMVECNNYWYDFNVGGAATTCLTTNGAADQGVCTIGTALCADGRSSNGSCTQSTPEFCVADAICSSCTTDPTVDVTCVKQVISDALSASAPVVPLADCSFVPDIAAAGQPCTVMNSNQIVLDLSPLGLGCTAADVRPLDLPLGAPMDPVLVGMASISVHLDQTSCQATLTWMTGAGSGTDTKAMLLDVTYATGKHVVMPLRIAFQQPATCPPVIGTFGCELRGPTTDMSFTCAKM